MIRYSRLREDVQTSLVQQEPRKRGPVLRTCAPRCDFSFALSIGEQSLQQI